jgi:tetratricopeptide (TPR) repeat protein
MARQSQDRAALSICLSIAGFVSMFANELEQAVDYAREGRKISYEINNLEGIGLSLRVLTMASIPENDDMEEENMYIEEITQWYQNFPQQWLVGNFLLGQGQIALRRGQFSEAITYFEESINFYESQGNKFFANIARSDSGHAFRNRGDLDKAIEIYTETILIWQDLGHRGAVANQLECFAFIAVEVGQWERAAKLMGAAEALREAADTPMLIHEQSEYDLHFARLKERADQEQVEAAWEAGRHMSMGEAVAYALVLE